MERERKRERETDRERENVSCRLIETPYLLGIKDWNHKR